MSNLIIITMTKIPFNIKHRPQIESGEYRVVTREDRPVEIKIWDLKGDFPVVGIYYDEKNNRDTAVQVTAEGRCSIKPGDEYCDDFFIVTSKFDMEFKQGGWYLCTKTHMFFEEGELYYCHRDGHIDDGCGRAYIGRNGYNIKYFQPITEIKEIEEELKSLIPDWKKNVKEFKKSALRLLDIARKEIMLNCEDKYIEGRSAGIELGKIETLKNIPKWHKADVDAFTIAGGMLYYKGYKIDISELEKLPKED